MYTSGSIQRSPRTMCAWERVRNFIIVKRIRIKDDSTEISVDTIWLECLAAGKFGKSFSGLPNLKQPIKF